MIITKKIITSLSEKLNLQYEGYEQDWIIEVADSKRIDEFLVFYQQKNLSQEEKKALLALIIASFDDLLNETEIKEKALWGRIHEILISDKERYEDLITYWSLDDEMDLDHLFKITPFMREI